MTIEFDASYLRKLEAQRQTAGAVADREQQIALLQPRPGERILDLGCGSGAYARALAPMVKPGGAVVGVDAAAEAVALAAQLSADEEPGLLSFEHADAHHLPFTDGAFDGAMCISVLAFCADPLVALQELGRVLRGAGRLVIASSDEDTRVYNGHDRELGRRVMRAAANRALDPWTGRRLAYWLNASGFRIVAEHVQTQLERRFTPDQSGYVMAHSLETYLTGRGGISDADYNRWLTDLEACHEEGS